MMFRGLQDSLLSLISPTGCQICGQEIEDQNDGNACAACWAGTRTFSGDEMLCQKCGAFFGSASGPAVRCHQCDEHHYDHAFAAGIYEKALAASIIRLKTVPVVSRRLANMIAKTLSRADLSRVDLVIPIPLWKQRLIERGFNQAELIARIVSRATGFQVDSASLTRRLHTPIHRMGMDRRGRELSIENAFEVVRPKLIAGKAILLVDDVFTSGATTSNCAKVLRDAKASSVNVFTLARAVMR